MWCCGIVTRVKRRDNKMIKVDIKLEEYFIACGESDITEEILKKHLWNPETPKKICVEAGCTATLDNN